MRTSKPSVVRTAEWTAACSRTSAPRRRASRANAGPTRRGLACPSSAHSDAPNTWRPSQGSSARSAASLSSCRRNPRSAASCAYASSCAISSSERASLTWPLATNSTSSPSSALSPSQSGRARRARGSSARWRPCWRTPPKLTPLAPAPQRFLSRSATVIPALRNATAAAQPAIPPPTIVASTRSRSVMKRSRASEWASPAVANAIVRCSRSPHRTPAQAAPPRPLRTSFPGSAPCRSG